MSCCWIPLLAHHCCCSLLTYSPPLSLRIIFTLRPVLFSQRCTTSCTTLLAALFSLTGLATHAADQSSRTVTMYLLPPRLSGSGPMTSVCSSSRSCRAGCEVPVCCCLLCLLLRHSAHHPSPNAAACLLLMSRPLTMPGSLAMLVGLRWPSLLCHSCAADCCGPVVARAAECAGELMLSAVNVKRLEWMGLLLFCAVTTWTINKE